MQKEFDKIDVKLDKLDSRLGSIDVTLAKQHVSLEDHIRRTDLLEQQIEPIKAHVAMVSGALKFIGILAMIAALVESLFKLFKF